MSSFLPCQLRSGLFTIQINILFPKVITHIAMPKLHTSPSNQWESLDKISLLLNIMWEKEVKTLKEMDKNRSIFASISSIKGVSQWVSKRETGECESYFHCQSLSVVSTAITPLIPAISSCGICQKTTAGLHLTCLSCPQASRPKTAA